MADQTPAGAPDAAARLARLSDDFFEVGTRSSRSMPPNLASRASTPWSQTPAVMWEKLWHPDRGASGGVAQHLKLLAAWMQDE